MHAQDFRDEAPGIRERAAAQRTRLQQASHAGLSHARSQHQPAQHSTGHDGSASCMPDVPLLLGRASASSQPHTQEHSHMVQHRRRQPAWKRHWAAAQPRHRPTSKSGGQGLAWVLGEPAESELSSRTGAAGASCAASSAPASRPASVLPSECVAAESLGLAARQTGAQCGVELSRMDQQLDNMLQDMQAMLGSMGHSAACAAKE